MRKNAATSSVSVTSTRKCFRVMRQKPTASRSNDQHLVLQTVSGDNQRKSTGSIVTRRFSLDLFEYQGKQYFARFDIPVPSGEVANTVDEAVAAADKIGYPVVIKAQVQVGGRGKAGGIQIANNAAEARTHATNILGI